MRPATNAGSWNSASDRPDSFWREADAGTELYHQGEVCSTYFAVKAGWIALQTLLPNGACLILDFILPGSFLDPSFSFKLPQPCAAICLSPVSFRAYSDTQFRAAWNNDKELTATLWRNAVLGEWRAYDHLVTLGLRSAQQRVARLMLELYVRLRGDVPRKAGEAIDLALTQSQIGQATGLTNVHVNRVLRSLREDGLFSVHRRKFKILSPHGLLIAAGLSPGDDGTIKDIRALVPEAWFHENAIAPLFQPHNHNSFRQPLSPSTAMSRRFT